MWPAWPLSARKRQLSRAYPGEPRGTARGTPGASFDPTRLSAWLGYESYSDTSPPRRVRSNPSIHQSTPGYSTHHVGRWPHKGGFSRQGFAGRVVPGPTLAPLTPQVRLPSPSLKTTSRGRARFQRHGRFVSPYLLCAATTNLDQSKDPFRRSALLADLFRNT